MKFLDLNGLTHFFGKVKTWAGNNYLSLNGGQINGGVTIDSSDDNVLAVIDSTSGSEFRLDLTPTTIVMTKLEENSDGYSTLVTDLEINRGNIKANQFTMNNGTSTEVLIANGSVKGIGSANGIAGLDSNGYVPLAQLGNLDTTVAEVVTALPTTNIKKHIYLIKDASGVTQNQYEEYLYTGNTSAAYDASKWEKLGDFRATVDLADYVTGVNWELEGTALALRVTMGNGSITSRFPPVASSSKDGIMSHADKAKLDGISSGATADSAITTAEIDALFA